MIKSVKSLLANDRPAFKVPRSAQQTIPINRLYDDGIWQVAGGNYSKTWSFSDINYSVASDDDQMEMFLAYCGVLNGLSTGAVTKITIANKRLNLTDFQRSYLLPSRDDGLNDLRGEYNRMLLGKATTGNGIQRERYITVYGPRKNADDARVFYNRVNNELSSNFARLSSTLKALNTTERLRTIHDFFRSGEDDFSLDIAACMRKGHDFRDAICPDGIQFKNDHFVMGNGKFGRVLFLKEYASYLKDSMIAEMVELPRNLMLSVDLVPVATTEAVQAMQRKIDSIETEITRWQKKQNERNNFMARLPYDMEQQREETKGFLDDLTTRDQRLLFASVVIVHLADSIEELESDTETLKSVGSKNLCTFSVMKWQQEDALATALPYGLLRIKALRTLTTESAGVLFPFAAQEIQHSNGNYIGLNAVSRNMLMCNRKLLQNGNGIVAGTSGSGKSLICKAELLFNALANVDDDILILDPESEYDLLVTELGGQVVRISADSDTHINAMEINADSADIASSIKLKSEFILSLCEQFMNGYLGPREKSIIDRCVTAIYRDFLRGANNPVMPTLQDFHSELLQQPETEAREIALSIELFTSGSLNTFAYQSNVKYQKSRIVSYNIQALGKQLKSAGMLVILSAILNRVEWNFKRGKYTHILADELMSILLNEYASNFFSECWRRFRKYGGLATGILQNLERALEVPAAKTLIGNSEYLVLMNQSPTDRAAIASLLSVSESQMSFITNTEPGRGLLKVGGAMIPFINEFPTNTRMYELISTKPSEKMVS